MGDMVFKRQTTNDETQSDSTDFEKMLQESFGKTDRRISVGDRVKAEVLSVGKDKVMVSTGSRLDGSVMASQLQDEAGVLKVKVGDFIDLFVTYIKGSEVHLSPNASHQNLADDITEAFSKGLPVTGKVTGVNRGGFEVLVHGKSAFCPLSQMDLKRIENPADYVSKSFEFHVSQISEGGRNVVVSRRRLLEEGQGLAQAQFKDQQKVGATVTGKVTRIQDFGAFIEIAPGMEGLAHISEISWTRLKSPSDVLKVGDVVQATILKIEESDRRLKISLTLKQASNDPWKNLPSGIQQGNVIEGKITRCMPFGAFVEVAPGMEGLIPLSEMSSTKRVAKAEDVVNVGDTVKVLIKEVSPATKRISLSIKDALDKAASDVENENIRDYMDSQKAQSANGSLGDLASKLQAALDKKTK